MASRETTPYRLDKSQQKTMGVEYLAVRQRSLTAKRRRHSEARRIQL